MVGISNRQRIGDTSKMTRLIQIDHKQGCGFHANNSVTLLCGCKLLADDDMVGR